MRALKFLVVTMAVLIVAGLAVVVVTIVNRSSQIAFEAAEQAAPVAVEIPAGSRIVETRPDGERLVLRLALADGAERIVVIDIASGRTLRRIDLRPAGDAAGAPAPPR